MNGLDGMLIRLTAVILNGFCFQKNNDTFVLWSKLTDPSKPCTLILPGSTTYSEKEMLLRMAEGDEKAFRLLFDSFMQPLCSFGFQLIQHKEEAEDIAIRVFEKLWENPARFTTIETVKGYLFTSMRNGCLNYLRHQKVKDRASRQLATPETDNARAEAQLVQAEVMQRIYAEIESLSPQQREVLILNVVHGLSIREIAEKLRISESHVRADRSRAIGYLRAVLAKKGLLELCLLLFPLFSHRSK